MRMPETKDRLRPMRSIKKMAQRREAISLIAPSTAVVNSFLDWPVKPNRANNSGAYAAVCQYPYHAMIGNELTGNRICSGPLAQKLL